MSTPALNSPREGGVELLRIVLMLFIIGHHTMVHGVGLYDGWNMQADSWIKLALNSFFVVAVNSFVFISGYFSIRLKSLSIIKIVFQTVFYSVAITLVFVALGRAHLDQATLLTMFLPVSNNVWWFISNYIFLMLISPLLNLAGQNLEKKQLGILILGFLVLETGIGFYYATQTMWGFNGYALMNFTTIYLIGAWLKRFHIIQARWVYFVVWIAATASIFGLASWAIETHDWPNVFNRAFAYNNPLLYFSAISLFFIFKSLPVTARFVFFFSPLILGVYLIHDHPSVRDVLYTNLLHGKEIASYGLVFLWIPLAILTVFVVGACIEAVRARAMAPLEKWVAARPFFKAIDAVLAPLNAKKSP